MQKQSRYPHIDFIRGFAIIIMIFTHTSYYFSSDKLVGFLWNYSHFVVPLFLFASSYIFFQRPFILTISSYFQYFKKRFTRLLIPYYIYLALWILLNVAAGKQISLSYTINSIFLFGGNEYNWFILLFLIITVLLPFLASGYQKQRMLLFSYTGLSLLSSLWLVFFHFPYDYKLIMWLPWSLIPLITLLSIHFEKWRWFYLMFTIIGFTVFFILYEVQTQLHHPLGLYDNKYPPNLYYLSYGSGMLGCLLLLLRHGLGNNSFVHTVIYFFSKYSYTIFFIHVSIIFILLNFFKQIHFQWYSFFLTVLFLTALVQFVINNLKSSLRHFTSIGQTAHGKIRSTNEN